MKAFFVVSLVLLVLAYIVSARRKGLSQGQDERGNGKNAGAVFSRLSEPQILALLGASFDKPIYAENPRHRFGQMPDGSFAYSLRTVESLVRRGYLVSNGRGGYLLTQEGADALKKGMGF